MSVHSIVLRTLIAGGIVPASETGVAGYIARWRPASASEPAASFARDVVARVAPADPGRAKNLLWAAAKLADYAMPLGLDPVPQVLLHPSVTERLAAGAPGRSDAARRTLRTNLRFLARRVVPWLGPAPAALPRHHAKAPYISAEIAGYLALAGAQPTLARQMRAGGLVCLGAGAGLTGADLRGARGTDIACRSGGVIVDVVGRRPRTVPVLARYHDLLLASAQFAGEHLVTGGRDPDRNNVTTPLITALSGGTGLPRLEASRLRATWLADCAQLLGLATFMDAAGITCSQRLGDIIAALERGGEAQAVALLGGTPSC
jgi:integrase